MLASRRLAVLCVVVGALSGGRALALFGPAAPTQPHVRLRARAPVPVCATDGAADEAANVFEVTVQRPLGVQWRESDGVVSVGVVMDGGNAAEQGIQAGDVVLATSASMGSQMWPKSTLEGVQSAIQTRVDGMVRFRLRRASGQTKRTWAGSVRQTYEVELSRPLGIVLRELPADREVAGIEVAELAAEGSAAASGMVRVGDLLLATSASVGEQMWAKSTVEGALSAISTRLALSPTVRLRLARVDEMGEWADELQAVVAGERTTLSPLALRSLRSQWRELCMLQAPSAEIASAVRNITLPAVYQARDRHQPRTCAHHRARRCCSAPSAFCPVARARPTSPALSPIVPSDRQPAAAPARCVTDPTSAGAGKATRRGAASGRPRDLGGRGRPHAARNAAPAAALQAAARLHARERDDECLAPLRPRAARPRDV